MCDYDKPFRTYDEQISYLKTCHGLDIHDADFARRVLRSISYYDIINGYKDSFMEGDKFKPHISIEFLYQFYSIDREFQDLLFNQILLIENHFKTELAYVLAKDFGVHELDYLAKKNFLPKHNKIYFDTELRKITSIYNPVNNLPIPQPTRHYLKNHNHIPPWILFKNISFGTAINLFQLMKPQQKRYVTNALIPSDTLAYKQKVEFLINGLNLSRRCRNTIAHNLKFISFKEHKNKLSAKLAKALFAPCLLSWTDISDFHRGLNDIYAALNICLYIVPVCNPSITNSFCNRLLQVMVPQDSTSIEFRKKGIFDSYAMAANLPANLAERIMAYKRCIANSKL